MPDAVLLIVGGGPYEKDLAGWRGRPGSPAPSASPVPCPGRSCPRTTARATSSRCRAGPGGAGSTSRGSGSCTWRPRRPGCPSSRAIPAALPTRCSTARPAGWCAAARPEEAAERIVALLGDAGLRRRMGERGRAWVEEKWRWDLLARTAQGVAVEPAYPDRREPGLTKPGPPLGRVPSGRSAPRRRAGERRPGRPVTPLCGRPPEAPRVTDAGQVRQALVRCRAPRSRPRSPSPPRCA